MRFLSSLNAEQSVPSVEVSVAVSPRGVAKREQFELGAAPLLEQEKYSSSSDDGSKSATEAALTSYHRSL